MAEHLGIRIKTMDSVWKETKEGDEREIKATIEGTATMLDKHGRIKNRAIKWGGNILTFTKRSPKDISQQLSWERVITFLEP